MEKTLVEKIADAVLYEGYMLYPYRASSVKNQKRFNWGALAPRSYSDAENGTEAWEMRTECLLAGDTSSQIRVKVRFLQLADREVLELTRQVDDGSAEFEIVPSLEVNGQLYQAWQEALEREVDVPVLTTGQASAVVPFRFVQFIEQENLNDADGKLAGKIIRTRREISGEVGVNIDDLNGNGLYKITVLVRNTTPFSNAGSADRDAALLRSIVSTHTILNVDGGEFVSLLDPPEQFAEAAAGCENKGAYPVLAGDNGRRDCMLSSPIILYDFPEIAPESPGDLFDGTEIDEILTLRIMTLTEQEKREMRSIDDRARKILERTEIMPEEQLRKMHGALRGLEKSRKMSHG